MLNVSTVFALLGSQCSDPWIEVIRSCASKETQLYQAFTVGQGQIKYKKLRGPCFDRDISSTLEIDIRKGRLIIKQLGHCVRLQ